MKKKISYEKFYKNLDSATQKVIDGILEKYERCEKVIRRIGVDNKELTIEEDESSVIGWVSRGSNDHSSDLMVPDGVNLEVYNLNPIVLFNHDRDNPIAKCEGITIEPGGVKGKTTFVTAHPVSKDMYTLVKAGVLRAFSIGFLALDYVLKGEPSFPVMNQEMTDKYPDYNGEADRIVTKWLLIEYSVVTIPDNYQSIITEKNLTICDDAIKVLIPVPQIDKTVTVVDKIDKSITIIPDIDRSVKVLKEKEQKIIKLSDMQKKQVEDYYTHTKMGRTLRYSLQDIIDGKVTED